MTNGWVGIDVSKARLDVCVSTNDETLRDYTNDDLEVRGAIATLFDGRTKLAHQVVNDVREQYGIKVLEPFVPKSVKVAEAPAKGRSVLTHAPRSRSAAAYRELAGQLLAKKGR